MGHTHVPIVLALQNLDWRTPKVWNVRHVKPCTLTYFVHARQAQVEAIRLRCSTFHLFFVDRQTPYSVGGWMCKRVSVYVSVYVCCTHLFSFFPLAFVLVNDLSLASRCFLFWKCVRFCFRFCCRLFLFVVCTCILCLLPCLTRCSFTDVLSCTTGVSEINYLT